jgi:shikimate dehydrogenase
VLAALAEAGVARLVVANRHPHRAARLIDALDLAGLAAAAPLDAESLSPVLPAAALVVNATAVGWHGDETPLVDDLLGLLPVGAVVYDLTYRQTALLRAAGARGQTALDGLRMLVYQGARSFELWTGRAAPLPVMLAAAEAALAARDRG